MTRPSKPEHFAAIVDRYFVRLKELTMYQPDTATDPPPSAEDHYTRACDLLDQADTAGTPLAEVHAFLARAHGRLQAAEVAVQIWPAKTEIES